MEKYSVDRWNSDAFSSKEIAKIENDLKNNLKILPHPLMAGGLNQIKI